MNLLQFTVPAIAARAIRIENAAWAATKTGIEDKAIEYVYDGDVCRITTSREIALGLVEVFRMRAATKGEPSTVVKDCALAATAILDALSRQITAAKN